MKKAEMAIGTMILFIAMLIVTATTVAVLFQTSQSLQSSAQQTSQKSNENIVSKLQILSVYGTNGSEGRIKNIFIEAKLNPGSKTLNFNNSVLILQTPNKTATLSYSRKPCVNVSGASGNGYFTNPSTGIGNFSITYLESGSNYTTSRIDTDDIVKICFSSPIYINELEQVNIKFIPSMGTSNTISFLTPAVLVNVITSFYP